MNRRIFVGALTLGLLAAPLAVEAQQAGKIPRLCFLTFDPGTLQSNRFGAFFEGLRDLGYVDGRTIAINYLSAEGHGERFPALAAECVSLKADIIAVSTTPAAHAAKNATRSIPIVMLALGAPVESGVVTSLGRPGGNVTGLSSMAPGLAVKRLELRSAMSLTRFAVGRGGYEEARELLRSVYASFTEGFDTKDLQEAKALLNAPMS